MDEDGAADHSTEGDGDAAALSSADADAAGASDAVSPESAEPAAPEGARSAQGHEPATGSVQASSLASLPPAGAETPAEDAAAGGDKAEEATGSPRGNADSTGILDNEVAGTAGETASEAVATNGGAADAGSSAAAAAGAAAAASATEPFPPNSYAAFRNRLKHHSARPVISQVQAFVSNFQEGQSRPEAATRVHKFLTKTQEWMCSQSVVFAAEADEEGKTNAAEGLEKFLLSRLHATLFTMNPEDQFEDAKLRRHIAGLHWVEFRHLGIPPVDKSLLDLAVVNLQKMDDFKAPRDKLVCVLNACHVISDVLKRTLAEQGAVGRPLSADDFLPLLIFSVLMANPPRLHSNLEYITHFRHPTRLVGEDAYFLTSLQSAVAFVRDAGPKVLDIELGEYERLYAAAVAAYDRRMGLEASRDGMPPRRLTSTVGERAAELRPEVKQQLAKRFQALPLRFEAVTSACRLCVAELPSLLEEYRELAHLLRAAQRGYLDGEGGEAG